MTQRPPLGIGIGWRPQLASFVLQRPHLGFVEILAESFPADRPLPLPLVEARRRGVVVVPHGVGLGLGGAEPPEIRRLEHLGQLAQRVRAPLVSEHVAFVRSGGREAGHLLPLPRTRAGLEVLVENVRMALEVLPVPLALEPIAALFDWPGAELDEAEFLTELVERTGVWLLLDVANVYANARNRGEDPMTLLDRLPLDRVAYVHIAGGCVSGGLYHDTHAAPVPPAVIDLLAAVAARAPVAGVMLERDDRFPPVRDLDAELDAIARAAGPPPACAALHPSPAGRSDRPPADLAQCRDALAAGQHQVVRALLDRTGAPAGFDPGRIDAAAVALRRKLERTAQS